LGNASRITEADDNGEQKNPVANRSELHVWLEVEVGPPASATGKGQTHTAKSAIVVPMADAEAIRRKRELLAAELYAYFWLTCKELTA
jgi:hypothetical protein